MNGNDRIDLDVVQVQFRTLVERICALLATCDRIERGSLILVPYEDWADLYRLLIELHEQLFEEGNLATVTQIKLRIDLKLAVLEALAATYVDSGRPDLLH